jgi:hypothetical protein
MAKSSTRNNKLLRDSKQNTSPKIYSLLVSLVNSGKEIQAEEVLKVDYLLQYASTCIKQKDSTEARVALDKAKARINMLKKECAETEYLEYLYKGISEKTKE